MKRPKYTLTEQQFEALRKTLAQRNTTPFLDRNIEAAHAVLVDCQPVRVVATSIGKSTVNLNRVVRELWCIAHGFSKWDSSISWILLRAAHAKGARDSKTPAGTPAPHNNHGTSRSVLWPPPERPPVVRRLHSIPDGPDSEKRSP